ncbi:MAG: hypothetical protein IIB17_08235 [Chloroflexi bacterium]|nr:hypothetical protein [Chloroflexota bacterium]
MWTTLINDVAQQGKNLDLRIRRVESRVEDLDNKLAPQSRGRLSDEITNPIFQSRDQLAGAVKQFVSDTDVKITIPSPEWERLVTFCQDEYAASNPEIAGNRYLGSIGRVEKPAKRGLSKAFERYQSERTRRDSDSPITAGSIEEFKVGVDRFIELYGDLDVNKINRTHAQDFRDTLRKLPARPPNAVRELSLRDQVSWAEENNHRLLAKDTVAKLTFMRPPNLLAEQFEEFAAEISSLVQNLTMQNERLEEARDLLLPRLMNGELAA